MSAPGLNRLVLSIPTASPDGKYYGRYPKGNGPGTALAGAASSTSGGSGTLGSAGSPIGLVALGLTAAATNATVPYTFGHPFKKGDVPAGQYLTATSGASALQVNPLNYWSDGSLKFASISGLSSLTANTRAFVQLATTSIAPSGTPLSLADLQAANPQCSAAFSGGINGTVELRNLLALTSSDAKDSNGLVRQFISGPTMSEWHFYSNVGSGNQVGVWFYVRLYSTGDIEIETAVEDGWISIANPTDITYGITLTVNGTVRYSNTSLDEYQRTAWFTINWYTGGTSGLTDFKRVIPQHDAPYCRATGLLPNVAVTPSPAALDALTTTIAPMSQCDFPTVLGSAGYAPHIGLIPHWDAAYAADCDPTAFQAMIANVYASNTFPIRYRDETSLRVLAPSRNPYLTQSQSGWTGSPIVVAASGTSANPLDLGYSDGDATAHAPSPGHTSYLFTARFSHLETLAFWAQICWMWINPNESATPSNHGLARALYDGLQDRGRAWAFRLFCQVAALWPDASTWVSGNAVDEQVKTDYLAIATTQVEYFAANSLSNNLGCWADMYLGSAAIPLYNKTAPGDLYVGSFQNYFMAGVVGFVSDIEPGFSNATLAAFNNVKQFFFRLPVGMLGGSRLWQYQQGAQYSCACGYYNSAVNGDLAAIEWDANWGAAWQRALTAADVTAPSGTALTSGHFPDASSYFGNLQPGIAYAVDQDAPGALAAWNRQVNASNWAQFTTSGSDPQPKYPEWAVAPRTVSAFPSWRSGLPLLTWTQFANTDVANQVMTQYANPGGTGGESGEPVGIAAYSGATLNEATSDLLFSGGGHSDWAGNEQLRLALNTANPHWLIDLLPTENVGDYGSQSPVQGNPYYADGSPSAAHGYAVWKWVPLLKRMMRFGCTAAWGNGNGLFNTVDAFDPSTGVYDPEGTWPVPPTGGSYGVGLAQAECYTHLDYFGNVWHTGNQAGALFRFAPLTQVWTPFTSTGNPAGAIQGGTPYVYDPARHLLFQFPNGPTPAAYYDLTKSNAAFTAVTLNDPNAYATGAAFSPVYCPDRDSYLFLRPGSNVVYELDPSTYVVSILAIAGAAPTAPTDGTGQFFSRFSYVPRLHGCIFMPSAEENVWFFPTA
ncbi:MAG: hypothetical protein ACREUT_21175 [Steroidobacteraceae bacterium]